MPGFEGFDLSLCCNPSVELIIRAFPHSGICLRNWCWSEESGLESGASNLGVKLFLDVFNGT